MILHGYLLTAAQEITLSEMREAENLPQRTRDRAHIVRMNTQGWNAPKIAEIFKCHEHTVRSIGSISLTQ